MYSKDGENYFIVDAHLHMWDGSDANQRNVHGAQFIECFYDYHRNLSPEEYVWPFEKYQKYTEEDFMTDIFDNGYADHAIFNPAALNDFYVNGFSRDLAWDMAQRNPDRLTYNHNFDPRNGEVGLRQLEEDAARYNLKGIKLYTAEWHGDSRGYKLSDSWSYRYLEKCQELNIKNIHVHKGPTIRPLDRDAFDVSDVDHCATDFPDLNFIV
jgi:predicted TIM-barrel fold metal-dependent hydrolase